MTNPTTLWPASRLQTLAEWAEQNALSCDGDDFAPFVVANGETWRQVASALRQAPNRQPWLACYDCGLPYGDDGWCDCVVPDGVWARISPTGDQGGILCLHCIARRLVRRGIVDVPLKVASGPFCGR